MGFRRNDFELEGQIDVIGLYLFDISQMVYIFELQIDESFYEVWVLVKQNCVYMYKISPPPE